MSNVDPLGTNPLQNDTYKENINDLNQEDNSSILSPNQRGESSVSGTSTSPSSDDDLLKNAHEMGIAPDADLESPQELNLAQDVKEAEEYHQEH